MIRRLYLTRSWTVTNECMDNHTINADNPYFAGNLAQLKGPEWSVMFGYENPYY